MVLELLLAVTWRYSFSIAVSCGYG